MPKTILLGLDGLDWQLLRPLIARGELPSFQLLVEQGVAGNLSTLRPTLSPILWNSIATGKRAIRHGIHGFTEVDPHSGLVRPVSSLSRSCKAVWNILQQNGSRCHLLNWFASHPAEPLSGCSVSNLFADGAPPLDQPWPLRRGIVHPERLEPTLADLRMSPDELDGDLITLFVPRGAEVDQAKDKRLFVLARELARALSIHNVATWLLENEPVDFLAAYWPAPDLLFHTFMPYHPPAIDGADPADAEIYGEVVNGVCRLFDRMLGAYLRYAGPDANIIVISDHGFQSGPLRPAFDENPFANPEAWHRPQGVFLAKGPLIKSGAEIHGASLLDITPTVLALHGLAPARDMDGRVLAEAFKEEPKLDYIDSWENIPGDTGQHPPGTVFDAADAAALVRQFVDLGYIEEPDQDKAKAAEQTREVNRWNLARDLLDAGRPGFALPILEELHHAFPHNPVFAQALAGAQKQVGLAAEADATLARLTERLQPGPQLQMLRAETALEKGRFAAGLQILQELEKLAPNLVGLHLQLARTYVGLERYEDAQREFEKVLKADPDNALACQGLARVYLRKRFWEMGAATALRAVSLQHNLPIAHLYLAYGLERMGRREIALDALRTAIGYAPRLLVARYILIRLLSRDAPADSEAAKEIAVHQAALEAIRQQGALDQARLEQVRAEARARAAARAAKSEAAPEPASAPAPSEISAPAPGDDAPGEFVLVSGLPRSGTSLMMQMLHAAGLPLQTDGLRAADLDNTEGYFEWEAIKTLPKNPRVLDEARGRGLKVISMLLPALPRHHRYKILFMVRPVEEVAASQLAMLQRRFPGKTHASPEKMAETLRGHREDTLKLLRNRPGVEVLEVDYPALVRAPAAWTAKIAEFLGPRWPFDPAKAAARVKPELHRQRV